MKPPMHKVSPWLLPDDAWQVVQRAWSQPFTVSCDFARQHAQTIATCASLGLITNLTPDRGTILNRWHVTTQGVSALEHKDYMK